MDKQVYNNIVRDIKNMNGLNVNDECYNVLSKKYPSISEETLRSIIGLWFQRQVTQNAYRVKEMNIYELYKQLLTSGTTDACLQIAHQLVYPPSLIAKIVLTSYLAEMKSKKNKINPSELKNLRRQQCPYCKSILNNSVNLDSSQRNDSPSAEAPAIKRHHDPRVELALNLFDDDDEIGKYFFEKFTFSNDKAKNRGFMTEQNKSNKFFWQASSFEEMGEKNVKKFANVEKLFRNRFAGNDFAAKLSGVAELTDVPNLNERLIQTAEDVESEIISSVNNLKLTDSKTGKESSNLVSIENRSPKLFKVSTPSPDECSNLRMAPSNDINSSFDDSCHDSVDGADLKICTCGSGTVSDDSDSDSEDSDEAYENFNVKELFENPSLIEDPILARDVFYCTTFDDQYGPTSDVICSSAGITHEKLLEECAKIVGLEYKTEHKLRGDGFDKTPDIILLVPVAVKNFVINWIESKALFADYKLHKDFEKKQFQNYVNRFGPGMVIYWHGYVSLVMKSEMVNKQIIISDKFPAIEDFTFVKSDKFKSWMQLNRCHEA